MRVTLRWLALVQLLGVPAALGQTAARAGSMWSVGLSIGTSTFNGATTGTGDSGEDLIFVPYRPTMVGAVLTHGGRGPRIALSLKHGEPGIGFRGVPLDSEGRPSPGLLIIAENAFKLTSVTAAGSVPLVRLRGGPTLRPSLGLTVERWTAPGTPARRVMGPQTGLALELALGGAFTAAIEGELGFSPKSPFRLEDLPEGFTQRSTWRRSLGVAVYLKL